MSRDFSPRQAEHIGLNVTYLAHSDRAVKVDSKDLSAPVWVPFSALHFETRLGITRLNLNETFELRVEERMAREKGLLQ